MDSAEWTANDLEMAKSLNQNGKKDEIVQELKKAQWHDILKEKPKKSGLYLCNRMWRHQPMYELIYWTGEYWTTGGDVDDIIIAWYDFPEYEVLE